MKYTVLVTGSGAVIGYGIIRSLRRSGYAVRIVAIDIYDHAFGKSISDVFYKGVLAYSEEFVDFINDIIIREKVDLIIPGIEQDLYALHKHKDQILCPIVMNNDLCIELSKSKLDTYNYLKENSAVNLIPTLYNADYNNCVEKLGYPFLLKPISSYASKGIEKISSEIEFDFFRKRIDNKCIFQKITGSVDDEFTVSVFGDGKGGYFDSIILKRYLSQEGATSRAEILESNQIMAYIGEIATVLKPIGPTNIQIRMENNLPYLLEINPRISSACSIRTAFNYNEPEMCVKFYLEKEPLVKSLKKKGTVIRYIEDYIRYE